MSSENVPRTRRTDAQIQAELRRRLAKFEHRKNVEKRKRETLRKILYGAGVLALKDPLLLIKIEDALSPRDQLRLQQIRMSAD
jgi:hypothetical protein